ncbi:MAG: hypothetical protein HY580_06615 [Nitrospinae bacterium]|nr:hypothetical protein [Nitrospinota bacterium]
MHKIAIRCKASSTHGMGHLVRQLHLGKSLSEAGNSVVYFVDDYRPAVEALDQSGFPYHIAGPGENFLRKLTEAVDLAIIDQKDNDAGFIQNLRPRARKIASFEDLGDGRNLVDLLVDANLEESRWGDAGPGVRGLFGLPYIVLHPEFERYNRQPRSFPSTVRSALITMGGTDPKNLTVPLARALLERKNCPALTAVTGAGFRDWLALEKLQMSWSGLQALHNIPNMAEILAGHDIVFCAGGVTLHEAMAVGTPAFAINQVPHQEKKARYFEERGAAVNLGMAENWDAGKVLEILELKGERLESMSRIGKDLVDGKGLRRVAEELGKLMA